MKRGKDYARQIKSLFNRLKRQHGKPQPNEPREPIDELILAILARDTTDAKAETALKYLLDEMVDHNDLRVTPWMDVAVSIAPQVPDAEAKARDIVDAMNGIYDRYNLVDLSALKGSPVREAREALRSLPGVDEFAAARVVLFCLGGHALPIDGSTLGVLRHEKLVAPDATLTEVQSFLERHIPAAEGVSFVMLMRRYVATRAPQLAAAKKKAEAKAKAASKRKSKKPAPDVDAPGAGARAAQSRSRKKPSARKKAARTKKKRVTKRKGGSAKRSRKA
jgi:endonuclease III